MFHCDPGTGTIARVHNHALSYNGVGLSPDGATVYVADTFLARLYAIDAKTAGKQNPRLVATIPGPVGLDSLDRHGGGTVCLCEVYECGISSVMSKCAVTTARFDDSHVTNIA